MNWYTAVVTRAVPIGSVVSIPTDFDMLDVDLEGMFIECFGQSLDKLEYDKLFKIIGIDYGESDGIGGIGTSHFHLPDYRGMFLSHIDDLGVMSIGDYVEDQIIDHSHEIDEIKNDTAGTTGGVEAQQNRTANNQSFGLSNLSGGLETRPINVSSRFCVRYR